MKKTACFLLVAVLIGILCSCGSSADVKPQLKNIGFVADVSTGKENSSFYCFVDKSGGIKASAVFPESAADMLFVINSKETKISYKGKDYSPSGGFFPAENTVQALYDAISDASKKNLSVDKNENCVSEGKIGCGKYIFTFSPAGLPLTLEIPPLECSIVFKDVYVDKI